jgi:hypothetical protein
MSIYTDIQQGMKRALSLLLMVLMILIAIPISSHAADETLYGYRVNYNNTQTQITNNIGWFNSNLGNGWAEGDWVPYQLVLTGITSLTDLPEVAVAYDFYRSQNDSVLVDLARGFQVRWSTNAGDNVMLTDSQMGYPSSQLNPITTVDQMEAAQANAVVGQWTGFNMINVPKEQINLGAFNGSGFDPLTPTSEVAHFRITDEQLKAAGVPEDVKTMVIYFQLHLSRTSLWSSGLFQHYGDNGVPAENWGGHVFKIGGVFDGVLNNGSKSYPGASGHAKLIGAVRTVPIPVPGQDLGSVSGYKWHDYDGDGVKGADEPGLQNWPIYISADIEGMSFVLSTLTDANGFYSFPALTYGTRYITEGLTRGSETGWAQTYPNSDFDVSEPFGAFGSYQAYFNNIPDGAGIVLADQGHEIIIDRNNFAFTNMNFGNRRVGALEITKLFDFEDVVGFDADMLPESIEILIEGPSFLPDGETFELLKDDDFYLLIENLIPGDYSITEINVGDEWEAPELPINVTVVAGETEEVEFTNVFKVGALEITKLFDFEDVEGFDADMLPDSIEILIEGPSFLPDGEIFELLKDDDFYLLLENLIPGDYSITEINVGDEWEAPELPIDVTVVAGETAEIEFTNVFKVGELEITKLFDFEDVEGFTEDMIPESIEILIEGPSFLPDGETFELLKDDDFYLLIENLIPGDYSITEINVGDEWEAPELPIEVTVVAGETAEIEFTNVFKVGELEITKAFVGGENVVYPLSIFVKVVGPSYPAPDGTIVEIPIDSVTGLGSITLENLIPGSYSVSELDFTGSSMWSSSIQGSPASVVAGAEVTVSVSITNTYILRYHDETAWARLDGAAIPFTSILGNNNRPLFTNWGWTNPITASGIYELDLYAGAGGNDISKGWLVGKVIVDFDKTLGTVKVTYEVFDGVDLLKTHLYVGELMLPLGNNNRMTNSPGQFKSSGGDTFNLSGFAGMDIYVAAHAEVRIYE